MLFKLDTTFCKAPVLYVYGHCDQHWLVYMMVYCGRSELLPYLFDSGVRHVHEVCCLAHLLLSILPL